MGKISLPQTVYFSISNFWYKLTQPNVHLDPAGHYWLGHWIITCFLCAVRMLMVHFFNKRRTSMKNRPRTGSGKLKKASTQKRKKRPVGYNRKKANLHRYENMWKKFSKTSKIINFNKRGTNVRNRYGTGSGWLSKKKSVGNKWKHQHKKERKPAGKKAFFPNGSYCSLLDIIL